MSSDPITWLIAGVEVATALGIGIFWVSWFARPHEEPWLPAGYHDHEAPFVYSDTVLAVVLVAGAFLQVTERSAGASLGLLAAGMLVFLGVLDLAYFARTGLFARERDGLLNAALVVSVLGVAAVLIVRFV